MISREELLKSPEYWFENAQNDLYGQVVEYMEKEGINQNQLAERLGVSKGYVSQILNGNFNYTWKKLIELSLALGKVPSIEYKPIAQILFEDKQTHHLQAVNTGSYKRSEPAFITVGFDGQEFTTTNHAAQSSTLAVGHNTLTEAHPVTPGASQFINIKMAC